MCNDLNIYHFAIVDQFQDDEEAESEQEVLDGHEPKIMELIDRIRELIGEPSQAKNIQTMTSWWTPSRVFLL